jgi:hypothetical protein
VESGGSLQAILRDVVEIVGYVRMRRYFETMGVNRVDLFFKSRKISNSEDLTRLDDLEARHILDQIIMKTNLPVMRVSDL